MLTSLPIFTASDKDEGVLVDLLGPLDVPLKVHVSAPTFSCVETAFDICFCAGVTGNQVVEQSM